MGLGQPVVLNKEDLYLLATRLGAPISLDGKGDMNELSNDGSLFGIAGFTGRDQVVFGAPAAPHQGYDMVHGQFCSLCLLLAIITGFLGNFLLPPPGFS